MSHIKCNFDVQVDGNHRWDEDRVCEISVYPVYIDRQGFRATDTTTTLASTEVSTGDYSDDCWYDFPAKFTELVANVPDGIREAVEMAIAIAMSRHLAIGRTQKYDVGQTVFLSVHRYPGKVEAHTVDGGYIIDMADSGSLAEFDESELEDYDRERWNR